MDVFSTLFLNLSLLSLVQGLSIYRNLYSYAGNENCTWLTSKIFPQLWNLDRPFVIVNLEKTISDLSYYQKRCKIVSLQTFTVHSVTGTARFDNEVKNKRNNRVYKQWKILPNSKVFITKTWLRELNDEGKSFLKLDLECFSNTAPLTRKCAVLSINTGDLTGKMTHHPWTRTLLAISDEKTASEPGESLLSLQALLMFVGIGLFGLVVLLFFCVERQCSKEIQNEVYVDEELSVKTAGSYHIKSEVDIPEEVAQSEPLLSKEEENQSRESGIDERTQQETDEEKASDCIEEHEYELGLPQSDEAPEKTTVGDSNTDSSAGIYEEVVKEGDVSYQNNLSRNSESLDVSNLTQSATDTSTAESKEGNVSSAKSKRKKGKTLKVNVKSGDSDKSSVEHSQPSSAGSKKGKKWFQKHDGGKHDEGKTIEQKDCEGDLKVDNYLVGGERQRMSTPDRNRKSLPEYRPLPPSPITPGLLASGPPVWPIVSYDDASVDDNYESVEAKPPMNEEDIGEATYETFDHIDSDSEMYTSVDETNRRTSVCASDTYDSVTATVSSDSVGCVYESVDSEAEKSETNLSPPAPSVEKLRKISVKNRTSTHSPDSSESGNISPRKSNPQPGSPVLQEDVAHLYSKPNREKKEMERKLKAQSKIYDDSTDHMKKIGEQTKTLEDENKPYEPVIPRDVKQLHVGELKTAVKVGENTCDSVSTQDYAEIIRTNSNLDKDTKESHGQSCDEEEDPYSVPPELPYRPPEIDEVFNTDYEECTGLAQNLGEGDKKSVTVNTKPNILSNDVDLSGTSDSCVSLYEDCVSSNDCSDPVTHDSQCTDSEDHYEELEVCKNAIDSNQL